MRLKLDISKDAYQAPIISVVVPCYNVGKTISGCLDSLLAQSFSNFEIICVDDGSTDDTKSVLKQYDSTYPKIRVVHKANQGAWLARLDGIRAARGEYIGFVDGDDIVSCTFLNDMYGAAENNNADIVVCGFRRIDAENGEVLSEEYVTDRSDLDLSKDPGRMLEINPAPWNKLFRSNLLSSLPAIESTPVMFDDLVLLLLSLLNVKRDVVFLPKALVDYHVRSDSLINSVRPSQMALAKASLIEVRRCYEENDLGCAMLDSLAAVAMVHLGISMPFRLLSSNEVTVGAEVESMLDFLDQEFPQWRSASCLTWKYAFGHSNTLRRAYIASKVLKLGGMAAFLRVYRFAISVSHRDIKW